MPSARRNTEPTMTNDSIACLRECASCRSDRSMLDASKLYSLGAAMCAIVERSSKIRAAPTTHERVLDSNTANMPLPLRATPMVSAHSAADTHSADILYLSYIWRTS